MKKRLSSFLAGAASALLLAALCTTALAASGQVSFNFAGVSVNGETKITAGQTITAANGQSVPGSILYTDAAGGKTNYLSVRTVSELLGVEVGYNSATRTILLNTKADPAFQAAPTAKSAGLWKAAVEEGGLLSYICDAEKAEKAEHDTLPLYRPTDLPEGWKLEETRGIGGGSSTNWRFETGGGQASFQCSYPGRARFSNGSFADLETVMKNKQQITVQSYAADFYTEKTDYGTRSLLAWENRDGILFHLTAAGVSREDLLQAAECIQPYSGQEASWRLAWLPEGSADKPFERSVLGDTVQETHLCRGTNFTLLASPLPLAAAEEGPGETVRVNGREARFWAAREPMVPRKIKEETVGGVTISSGVVSGYGSADMNTLLWSDPATGTNFRLTSGLDKASLIRTAESVTR